MCTFQGINWLVWSSPFTFSSLSFSLSLSFHSPLNHPFSSSLWLCSNQEQMIVSGACFKNLLFRYLSFPIPIVSELPFEMVPKILVSISSKICELKVFEVNLRHPIVSTFKTWKTYEVRLCEESSNPISSRQHFLPHPDSIFPFIQTAFSPSSRIVTRSIDCLIAKWDVLHHSFCATFILSFLPATSEAKELKSFHQYHQSHDFDLKREEGWEEEKIQTCLLLKYRIISRLRHHSSIHFFSLTSSIHSSLFDHSLFFVYSYHWKVSLLQSKPDDRSEEKSEEREWHFFIRFLHFIINSLQIPLSVSSILSPCRIFPRFLSFDFCVKSSVSLFLVLWLLRTVAIVSTSSSFLPRDHQSNQYPLTFIELNTSDCVIRLCLNPIDQNQQDKQLCWFQSSVRLVSLSFHHHSFFPSPEDISSTLSRRNTGAEVTDTVQERHWSWSNRPVETEKRQGHNHASSVHLRRLGEEYLSLFRGHFGKCFFHQHLHHTVSM